MQQVKLPYVKEVSNLLQKARAKGKISSSWKEAFMKVMAFELNFNGRVEFQEGNIRGKMERGKTESTSFSAV